MHTFLENYNLPKEKNKQTKKRNVFENVEKFKLLYTAGENVK